MPVQLQCVQLINWKTNEADLSSDVFAILINSTCNLSIVIKRQATRSKFGVIYLLLFGLYKVSVAPRLMIR